MAISRNQRSMRVNAGRPGWFDYVVGGHGIGATRIVNASAPGASMMNYTAVILPLCTAIVISSVVWLFWLQRRIK
jgi:hypothetical protein